LTSRWASRKNLCVRTNECRR